MPDDAMGLRLLDANVTLWQPLEADDPAGPATLRAVLRALVSMAGTSRRHEADVESALRAAGLTLPAPQRNSALECLQQAGAIDRIIPLADGGVLVSVTAAGMSRAARAH